MRGPRLTTPIVRSLALAYGAVLGGHACQSSPEHAAPEHRPAPGSAKGGPGASAKVYQVGETAETADYQLTVRSTRTCNPEPYFRARPGNVKLGVSVTLTNSSARPLTINPFYARLKDPDGKDYYFTLAGCEPILDATRLEPGKKTEGWLTFEIPEALRKVELVYRPLDATSESKASRFELDLEG